VGVWACGRVGVWACPSYAMIFSVPCLSPEATVSTDQLLTTPSVTSVRWFPCSGVSRPEATMSTDQVLTTQLIPLCDLCAMIASVPVFLALKPRCPRIKF
jgi:hypothetical protein